MTLMLALGGCGGDGNGERPSPTGSGGTAVTTIAAAPTPTPTPTPVPTSTSTVQSYTYETAANLAVDRKFTGYDRFSSTAIDKKFTTALFDSSDRGVTYWGQADSKITFADSSDLPEGGVFSFPGIHGKTGLYIESGGRLVALGLPDGLKAYQYFIFAEYSDSGKYRHFVIGSPTDPAELNKAVTLTYLAIVGEELNKVGVKPAPLSVDLAKSTVSGTVPMMTDNASSINVTLNGTIDATKHLRGTLQDAAGKRIGEFAGRPFGPGGRELALVVAVTQDNGTIASTRLTGTLQQ